MSDSGASRSQHKGSRRQAHRRVGSTKPFHNFESAAPHQGFDSVGQIDQFGRGFEPQNGTYHPEAGPVQDVQLNNNAAHSESSESERISALHGSLHGITLPNDTHGLQQYLAELQGELGRLSKLQESVSTILQDRSETKRLSAELKEEREKAHAADELHRSRLAQAESDCKAEAARARQLQQQVTALQEQERQLQHALYEAQRHVENREAVLAQWKDEQRAAEAESARKVAAAEAAAHRAEEELRAAQAENSALRQSAAERQPEEDKRKAEMMEIIEQWRALVKDKEDEVTSLQLQIGPLQQEAWHFKNEVRQMDAHYRRELDALAAAKAAVDAELYQLRDGGAAAEPVPALPPPAAAGPLQPAMFRAPSALPGVEGRTTPTPPTSRSAPQKGIRNGSTLDATQRSVAPELHLIMNGGSALCPPKGTPELLPEQTLVDALLDIVPRGEPNAKKFSQSDYQKLEAALGGRRWDQHYQVKYGSVADFMRTHPEAFYQSPNGAFYRPDAPARLPLPEATPPTQQAAPAPAPAGTSTALIIPPGIVKPIVVAKRPGVISAVVTPAAPAHLRAKRAAGSNASSDAKQQPQQEHPARTLAVPVNVALGSGRPTKASEKGSAAAAALQPDAHSQRSAEPRKPEHTNGTAGPSRPAAGYLHAAKHAAQASVPKHSSSEFPELNGGSKDRRREAPAGEPKSVPSMPPGLQRPSSAADRQSSGREGNSGGDTVVPAAGQSGRSEGGDDSNSGEPPADSKRPAAGGADKEKSKKKRNSKKVKGGTAAGIVGAP